jgi:hypothetical protein
MGSYPRRLYTIAQDAMLFKICVTSMSIPDTLYTPLLKLTPRFFLLSPAAFPYASYTS